MFYKSIEKVTTTVYNPSQGFVLNHVVKVAHKKQDGTRELFHTEYTYSSNTAYYDSKYLKSIKLKFSSYLLLEEVNPDKDWTIRESIYINYNNIHTIIRQLKKCRKWFYSKKHADMYYYLEGELKLNKEHVCKALQFKMYNKTIIIEPAVLTRGTIDKEGIKMYLNSGSVVCELDLDQIDTLYYVLKKFDLYQAGLSVINYIGRPPSENHNKDMGIESKYNDVANFQSKFQTTKGMANYYHQQQVEEKKKNEFADYF